MRGFAFLAFASFAWLSAASAATSQSLSFAGYFRPGSRSFVAGSSTCSPSGYAVNSGLSTATFTVTPPEAGMRVQYWIAAPNQADVVNDLATSGGASTRAAEYTETMTWTLNQAFSSSSAISLGVRFYWVTNSVAYQGNASGVSGSTATTPKQCCTNSFNLTANGFTRTGYTFANWTNAVGAAFTDGQQTTGVALGATNNNETVNLYAVWTANANSIGYDLAGGTYGSSHPASATYDVPFEVSNPTRTGYTFTGWKVTGGLDSGTAKYGSDNQPATSVSSADTLCIGANGSTWFKNLNPADGASATLTAQWTANTVTVNFNCYGATGAPSAMQCVYGEPYLFVSPKPSWDKGTREFEGFYTEPNGGGECYWDKECQPTKATWDIPTNTIFHAKMKYTTHYVVYSANGGSGTVLDQLFTNGVEIAISDGSGITRPGYELLGWAESPNVGIPEYQLGATVPFDNRTANVYLYAVWKEFYYVAFDGNGATNETPMAVQQFAFGEEKALSANEYGKVGYAFAGWATNAAAAAEGVVRYANLQVVNNLINIAGATNTLFAVWSPITYTTEFDVSAHSSATIAPSNCIYDVAFDLPVLEFRSGDLWKHIGWSNTVANVVYYTNEVTSVSNLCTTAGDTITLVAVWESMVGELSEAMDIYNLPWENLYKGNVKSWRVVEGEGHGTASCAAQTGKPESRKFWEMTTSVTNSGTLAFWWKTEGGSASLYYWSTQGKEESEASDTFVGSTEWIKVTIPITMQEGQGYESTRTIYLSPEYGEGADEDTIYIDQMTWTPEGESVEPTEEDVRDISGISFSGGTLSLTFTNADDRFSYNLRGTNELVTPLSSWPVLWTTNGIGTITIMPPVAPGEPKMFYYLETSKK